MEENNDFLISKKEEQQRVVYSFLEYIQQTKMEADLNEEALESVEVACQCLSNAFGVNLENQEQKKFSVFPHNLPSILNLGLNGSQKIEQAVEQLHKKQLQGNDPSYIEYKFFQYLQALKKRGAFNAVAPGSEEYEIRYSRARKKFMEKFCSEKGKEPTKEEQDNTQNIPNEDAIQLAENYKKMKEIKCCLQNNILKLLNFILKQLI